MLYIYIDGLVQDCSISIADALEMLQSCAGLKVNPRKKTGPGASQFIILN